MSIRVIFDAAFTPEEVQALVAAFEDALKALGLVDREDAVTKLVAEKIIAVAKTGERDPERLRDAVLAEPVPIISRCGIRSRPLPVLSFVYGHGS
jgi:hypothetical protein